MFYFMTVQKLAYYIYSYVFTYLLCNYDHTLERNRCLL